MTLDEAFDWLEFAGEMGGQLTEREQERVAEARRTTLRHVGAPWYEYEGIGPTREDMGL